MYVKSSEKPGELSYEEVMAIKDIKDMKGANNMREARRHARDVGNASLWVCDKDWLVFLVEHRWRNF